MAVALHGSEEALQLKEKFMAEVSYDDVDVPLAG